MLVVHQGALGDLVLSFPALQALKRTAGVVLHVSCLARHGPLIRHLGLGETWLPADGGRFASLYSHYPDRRFRQSLTLFDRAVLFGFSEALEQGLRRWVPGGVVRIPPRPLPEERIHVARHLLSGLQEAGLAGGSTTETASSGTPCAVEGIRERLIPRAGRVLLHPGAGSPRKYWPLERFAALGKALADRGVPVGFLLGPAERPLHGALGDRGVERERIVIPEGIVELLRCLGEARGLIGNDSGVSHLAGYLRIPTVTVFGPSDPLRWRPLGPLVRVLRPAPECLPCFETQKANCADPRCLGETTVDKVLHAYLELEQYASSTLRASPTT